MGISLDSLNWDAIFFLNRKDGFYLLDLFHGDTEPRLVYKYPAKEGDFFIYYVDTTKVEKTNIDYTVPAGTFKCYKYVNEYKSDNLILKFIYYISPGIGPIATENYYQDNNIKMHLEEKIELIAYKVN